MVPCKDKRMNIFNESTSPFLVEKMHKVNMTYYGATKLDGLIEYLHIEDENNMNFINSIEYIESNNHVIIK